VTVRLLSGLLTKFIHRGTLRVIDAKGHTHSFGDGGTPSLTLELHDPALYLQLFLNPELKAAEAYIDGTLTFADGGTAFDLLYLFSINRRGLGAHPMQKAIRNYWRKARNWHQANRAGKAQANARSHYDLSDELYQLFLGDDMQYSCAYFTSPDDTLEHAQQAKLRHIAAKLALEPGMTVAEIGGGWGGLAIYLARACGAQVTSINVSPEQIAVARRRAEEAGLADKIDFIEADYRDFSGSFDRVVSIGMMEHVGVPFFDTYFGAVRDLLTDDGYALIHAIGRMSPPGSTAPFIRKYIFPGGYVPALSEVFASTERVGLWVADNEILRLHYYYTIKHWRERFTANRAAAVNLYDERFCRMWEFYLAAVELGFLNGSNMVFQILLAKTRDAVPITRDFIAAETQKLKAGGE
jgi:cyclopropane-fatty-acyl-phospholipid synthase